LRIASSEGWSGVPSGFGAMRFLLVTWVRMTYGPFCTSAPGKFHPPGNALRGKA
jgi:hypothetical protein